MLAKKKLLILIPDGTGIKNYLQSDFIKLASENFDIILAHKFNKTLEKEINLSPNEYQHINIPIYRESIKHKFIRESLCYARLRFNSKIKKNPTILINWRRNPKKIAEKIFYKIVEFYGDFLSKKYERIIRDTKRYHQLILNSSEIYPFTKLLKETKPDLLFISHQRPLINVPFLAASKKLGVHSVSVIYSWDNMPKARIPYYSDYFFVWSDYMKREFDDYYPDIESKRIKTTGTPQFEFYLNKSLIQKKIDFFNKYKLDVKRPLVCYSGDDILTSPFDTDYLRDIAEIFSHIEIKKRPQIILRPSPADDGKRFSAVLKQFPDICYTPADWVSLDETEYWYVKFPKQNDIKNLVNLAYHADAVVNLGSTMAHDFAMFEKPAFYVNYMPKLSKQSKALKNVRNWSVKRIYKYEHFKSMEDLKPVYWIDNKNDFKNIINKINTHVNDDTKLFQKKWRDKIIGVNLHKNASLNISNTLIEILNESNSKKKKCD